MPDLRSTLSAFARNGTLSKVWIMKNIVLRMLVAYYLKSVTAWNVAFCSFAICVVITAHAGLVQGHTPPLIKPKQQETSTITTAREDDQP
jgi:hypothetical protein